MLSRSLRGSEFRVAWPIILLGVVGVFTSMSAALLYGFGALVVPLEDAFGWSREEITTSITFLFAGVAVGSQIVGWLFIRDRKSTRLNSSHVKISYAVFCLKKKKKDNTNRRNRTEHQR